ncbi:MAG: hypothetical protein LBD18_06745 [Treponema sp.]|nr:hypothetical protein [Treponema sp.]
MKKDVWNGVALLLVAIAVLALSGCPQEAELSSDSVVASVTVAGKTVRLGTPSRDWMEAKEPENAGVVFLTSAQMFNAEVVARKGQEGQKIYLAAAKPSVMPDFVDNETTFAFEALDFLWVEVFSENHDDYKLYAIQVRTSTPTVIDVTLGGRSAVGGVLPNGQPFQQYGKGMGTHSNDLAQASEGEIWFGSNERGTSLAVEVTPEDSASTVTIATGAADANAASLTFTAPSPSSAIATNGNYLYIKSVSADAQNGETIFYKLKLVEKEVNLVISDVTITADTGSPVSFDVGTMGTNGFGGGENHGNGALLAQFKSYQNILQSSNTTDVTVAIGTKPSKAKFRYGHTDFYNAQENVSPPPGAGDITLTYQSNEVLNGVKTGEYIAVEVQNELGDKGWYAFRVSIGSNSDITSLEVGGEAINIAQAKNTDPAGTNFVVYRPSSSPVDSNADSFWDSLAIGIMGGGATRTAIAAVDLAGGGVATAPVTESLEWSTISADNSYSFANRLTTGYFVIVWAKNEADGLDYYYKVRVLYGNSDATVTEIKVGMVTATLGTPGVFLSTGFIPNQFANGTLGTVTITSTEAGDGSSMVVSATAANNSIHIEYDWGGIMEYFGPLPFGTRVPNTTGTGLFAGGVVNQYVVARSGVNDAYIFAVATSEDRSVVAVYAVKCSVSY